MAKHSSISVKGKRTLLTSKCGKTATKVSFNRGNDKGIVASAYLEMGQNCDKSGFQQDNDKGVKNCENIVSGHNCVQKPFEPLNLRLPKLEQVQQEQFIDITNVLAKRRKQTIVVNTM